VVRPHPSFVGLTTRIGRSPGGGEVMVRQLWPGDRAAAARVRSR
jgi:hypothetical protein